MRSSLLWVTVFFILNLLNYLGWWGFNYNEFVIFDMLTAVILGSFVAGLKSLLNRTDTKAIKALFLALILSLLTIPFVLHYDITMTVLGKPMGTHPTLVGLFLEGLISTMAKTIFIVVFFYITSLLYFFIKDSRASKGAGSGLHN